MGPIVNSGYFDEDKEKRDSSVARYFCTYKFIMEHKETDWETVWSERMLDAMHLWVGWIEYITLLGDLGTVRIEKKGVNYSDRDGCFATEGGKCQLRPVWGVSGILYDHQGI